MTSILVVDSFLMFIQFQTFFLITFFNQNLNSMSLIQKGFVNLEVLKIIICWKKLFSSIKYVNLVNFESIPYLRYKVTFVISLVNSWQRGKKILRLNTSLERCYIIVRAQRSVIFQYKRSEVPSFRTSTASDEGLPAKILFVFENKGEM